MKRIDHHPANPQWTKLGPAAKNQGHQRTRRLGSSSQSWAKTNQNQKFKPGNPSPSPPFKQRPTPTHASGSFPRIYTQVLSSKNSTCQSSTRALWPTSASPLPRLSNHLLPPPTPLRPPPGGAKRTTHKRCDSCVKRADIHV